MIIKKAEYITSSYHYSQYPPGNLPEYAFTGRSNVGKSSLINMITGRKKLARISSSPGKTRLINHYIINDEWLLADLPGYGFAKVSKRERESFIRMIREYGSHRKNMVCLFLLIDARIPPQEADLLFMEWLGENNLPFVIVFTKIDKIGQKEKSRHIRMFKDILEKKWESFPRIFETSSRKGEGRDEILEFITHTNKELN